MLLVKLEIEQFKDMVLLSMFFILQCPHIEDYLTDVWYSMLW